MSKLVLLNSNSRTVRTAEKATRIVVCIAGLYLLGAFAVKDCIGAVAAALCIVGFVAGGVRITVGSASSGRAFETDAGTAVAFGAALVCGPFSAAGPAAMAALGRILLTSNHREPFLRSVYQVTRLPVQAALAGLTFAAVGGHASNPTGALSVPAALAAALVYALADRILSRDIPLSGVWLSLGLGYGLSGMVVALPAFAILVVALPLAVTLLGLLRSARQPELPEVQHEPEEEPAKPSLVDPLTGLANQRYLDMFLQQEISRSERSGQPITVLLADIDDFGHLNAAEGKDAADRCLVAIGDELRGMVRDYDLVARHKDDEFVVVLPETDADAGHETAQRLHSALSGEILPLRARFSIGVATYPAHGASVDNLLSSAHHALNRAKSSGKNAVRSCHQLAKAS